MIEPDSVSSGEHTSHCRNRLSFYPRPERPELLYSAAGCASFGTPRML
jgi:hypothetical protein